VPYCARLDDEARDVMATGILRLVLLLASRSSCRDTICLDQNGIFRAK
jgi:hypothetical protein